MTWCDNCSAYTGTGTVTIGHKCADCGAPLADHAVVADGAERTVGESAPWHFWVMVALLAIYLLWRLVQGVIWLV